MLYDCLPGMQDVKSCSVPAPKILAIGGEKDRGTKVNSGVMFINTTALAQHHYGLIAWGVEHKFPGLFDQTMIQEYFREDDLDQLPDAYNWKGYWGSTDDAVIAHWHGPKPMRGLECLVAAQVLGNNIDTACPQVHDIYRSVEFP